MSSSVLNVRSVVCMRLRRDDGMSANCSAGGQWPANACNVGGRINALQDYDVVITTIRLDFDSIRSDPIP